MRSLMVRNVPSGAMSKDIHRLMPKELVLNKVFIPKEKPIAIVTVKEDIFDKVRVILAGASLGANKLTVSNMLDNPVKLVAKNLPFGLTADEFKVQMKSQGFETEDCWLLQDKDRKSRGLMFFLVEGKVNAEKLLGLEIEMEDSRQVTRNVYFEAYQKREKVDVKKP